MGDAKRIGDWMQTYTGRRFWLCDPRVEDVSIIDIAHHLSLTCRFGGASSTFYSVAQHSVFVSDLCEPADAKWGLLHDAAEAYVGDLVRPLKRAPGMKIYSDIEDRILAVIFARYNISAPFPPSVKRADRIALFSEAAVLLNHGPEGWADPIKYTEVALLPSSVAAIEAEAMFLRRFTELFTGK
jgi:5'-deoxynucleotidase YfbR-like HD superfamily hydrolase